MDTQATVAAAAALHDVAGADRKAIGEMIGEPTHDELLPFGTKQAMSVPGIGSGTVPQKGVDCCESFVDKPANARPGWPDRSGRLRSQRSAPITRLRLAGRRGFRSFRNRSRCPEPRP